MECLTESCHGKPITRGLCKTCYYRLLRQVQRGNITWGILIAKGCCKKAKRSSVLTTAARRKNALNALALKELVDITPSNIELSRIADRFPAPREWYDE